MQADKSRNRITQARLCIAEAEVCGLAGEGCAPWVKGTVGVSAVLYAVLDAELARWSDENLTIDGSS